MARVSRDNLASAALVLVDIQLDFLPGGAIGVTGGDDIIEPIEQLFAQPLALDSLAE